MNIQAVGFIDSGSGGLSIWREFIKNNQGESTIYIGDHANLPYSTKTTKFIKHRVEKLITFLLLHQVKMIVIACNSATVAGIKYYRRKFPDIPLIGVVPVVKTAAEHTNTGKIAILSTAFTAKSYYQKTMIKKYAGGNKVYNIGSSNLVSYVEKGILKNDNIISELHELLKPVITDNVDTLALGCTHYPFLSDVIREIVGQKVELLDSAGAVSRHINRIITVNKIKNKLHKNHIHDFYTTGDAEFVTKTAGILLKNHFKNFEFRKIDGV